MMDSRDTELAIMTIQRLNQHNENLCQRVQDLIAENTRLRLALEQAAQTLGNIGSGFLRGHGQLIAQNEVSNIHAALKGPSDD